MNKKLKLILAILVLSATTLHAADSLVGTEQDPLVTKSYVDKKISEFSLSGGSDNSHLAEQIKEQEQLIIALKEEIASIKESAGNTYQVVTVPQGRAILGKQGTEMIIRVGEARIIGSDVGGVQDITEGAELKNDTLAPRFNLLLIPREDGRGLMAVKNLTIMVRGGYTLQ